MKQMLKKGTSVAVAYFVVKWTAIAIFGAYLFDLSFENNWYLLGIPLLAIFIGIGLMKGRNKTRFNKFFVRAIEKHFPKDASAMIDELNERYRIISSDTRFVATSGNPIDKRLDFSACFLALIQVLENRSQAYNDIRKICLEVTYDYVSPKNGFQRGLKRLPAKLVGLGITRPLINLFNKKISVLGHSDGFRATIETDKSKTYNLGYGIDILECGICKLFAKHSASKYASILCEVDKETSKLAGLQLIRNGTIANGAEKCDFRFKRVSKS
jgi:hypothetical protein